MLVWKQLPSREMLIERKRDFDDRVRVANAYWKMSTDYHRFQRSSQEVNDSCEFWLTLTGLRPIAYNRIRALREKTK